MKDMTDPAVQQEYEDKIYDGARDLAVKHKGDPVGMTAELRALGVPDKQITPVVMCMDVNHPDYEEVYCRGEMVDESVYEALKDCLRPLYGFA